MLGLSIGKLLVIIGVIVALWRGLKMITAFRDRIEAQERLRAQRDAERARAAPPARSTELFECPKCGTYVPNGTICPSREACVLKKAA
jgi:ribosomal protein L32